MKIETRLLGVLIIAMAGLGGTANAQNPRAEFSWMLPKTVIDVTVVYTFVDCDPNKGITIDIKPTLVARNVPDPVIGSKGIDTTDLASWRRDTSVSIKTYAGSHLLQSVGAKTTDQTATIINNVITGIGKALSVARGAGVLAVAKFCGPAKTARDDIAAVQKKISEAQTEILNATTDEARKAAVGKVEAFQSVLTSLVTKFASHTLTIQATVDPGYTPTDVRNPDLLPTKAAVPIDANGFIAKLIPTAKEMVRHGWINEGAVLDPEKEDSLQVNIYLDFAGTLPEESASSTTPRVPTTFGRNEGYIYREVAYIPLYVYSGKELASWAGVRPSESPASRLVAENKKIKGKLLIEPKRMVFGQYGRPMGLPFTAPFLQNLEWSISFLENGEVTDSSFVSKALGVTATNALNTALDSVKTIQDASSDTTRLTRENTELKARIDNMTLQSHLNALIAKQGSF